MTSNVSHNLNISAASSKQPIVDISPEFYKRFAFTVNLILTPLICIFGLAGNIVGLRVLGKGSKNKRMTVYTYLLALMTFDILYLILGLSESITEAIAVFDRYLGHLVLEHFAFARSYIDSVLNHVSSALLIFMSLERFIALVSPFTVKDYKFSRYPGTFICVTLLLASIYLLPFILSVHVVAFENEENRTEYSSEPKRNYFIPFDKFLLFEAILLNYLAPLAVLTLNVMIVVTYSRYLKQRSTTLTINQSDDQKKITVVVLCVAAMYILLSLPDVFIKTMLFIDDDYSFYGEFSIIFFFFISISDLMARINAATDFFIYVLVSSHHRAVFASMLCRTNRGPSCGRCVRETRARKPKEDCESPPESDISTPTTTMRRIHDIV